MDDALGAQRRIRWVQDATVRELGHDHGDRGRQAHHGDKRFHRAGFFWVKICARKERERDC